MSQNFIQQKAKINRTVNDENVIILSKAKVYLKNHSTKIIIIAAAKRT